MGVGTEIFGAEAGLFVVLLNLGQPLMIALLVPVHYFATWIYKRDHVTVAAYLRYMREPDYYDPWVHNRAREARPEGFGKGMHL